jgi:hypothetical protein
MDQPALQALLLRRGILWEPFTVGTVGFPVFAPDPDAALWHYCGTPKGRDMSADESKRIALEWMSRENGDPDFGCQDAPTLLRELAVSRRCLPVSSSGSISGFEAQGARA